MTVADALAEVFGDTCSCGCGPRATLHERGFIVIDEPPDLTALVQIENLIRKAERDSQLLNARDHDNDAFDEAFRLLAILRRRAASIQDRTPDESDPASEPKEGE